MTKIFAKYVRPLSFQVPIRPSIVCSHFFKNNNNGPMTAVEPNTACRCSDEVKHTHNWPVDMSLQNEIIAKTIQKPYKKYSFCKINKNYIVSHQHEKQCAHTCTRFATPGENTGHTFYEDYRATPIEGASRKFEVLSNFHIPIRGLNRGGPGGGMTFLLSPRIIQFGFRVLDTPPPSMG